MSTVYLATDPWWLRFKRAQHHMVEIKREMRLYTESHPYEVVLVPETRKDPNTRTYKLRVTRHPNPMLAVVLGEFFHCLRAALDNIVVASAPRQRRYRACFPVSFEDIWVRDQSGRLPPQHHDARESWRSAVNGLPVGAVALIEALQPYRLPAAERDRHSLGLISRFENADKHRGALIVGSGITDPRVDVVRDGVVHLGRDDLPRDGFLDDGAVVTKFRWNEAPPPDSEVEVKLSGTPLVTLRIAALGGGKQQSALDFSMRHCMVMALREVRTILRRLEPFVRR